MTENLKRASDDTLRSQNQMYTRALTEAKSEQVAKLEKYDNRKEDPFYKIQSKESRFQDEGDYYALSAFIPEHEKENIKVRIQPDKVTVSGNRSFADNLDQQGKKLSTNSYQTFREEFAFEQPVYHKAITQERRGDEVIFKIPKILSYNKKV
jgi:HSP20 family molecular chaperone IbpA